MKRTRPKRVRTVAISTRWRAEPTIVAPVTIGRTGMGVGAVNILNKGMHSGAIRPGELLVPQRITYHRPVPLRGALRRSLAETREIAGGINGGVPALRPATQPR